MEEMGITAIYPKPNLSKPAKGHQVYPYLLRNAVINRPNQAWSIDITYIKLRHGFVYLTAIIDWHSRCIVGWELDKAFRVAKPEILNSDQGCQFTSRDYIEYMDGKSR